MQIGLGNDRRPGAHMQILIVSTRFPFLPRRASEHVCTSSRQLATRHDLTLHSAADGVEDDHVEALAPSFRSSWRAASTEPRPVDEHNIEYEVFRRMQVGERSLARRAFYRREHARFRAFE
jgi:hypothetical protein